MKLPKVKEFEREAVPGKMEDVTGHDGCIYVKCMRLFSMMTTVSISLPKLHDCRNISVIIECGGEARRVAADGRDRHKARFILKGGGYPGTFLVGNRDRPSDNRRTLADHLILGSSNRL
jgi:hypothetical protein